MAEITEINSIDLMKNCYGIQRKQKKGSCWFDSALELLFNSDVVGEIVRSECFDYGFHKGRVVPYRVKPSLLGKMRADNVIFFLILNYILFNFEITEEPTFIEYDVDKYTIRRKTELDVCEIGFENFMAKIQHILVYYLYQKDIVKKDGTPKYVLDLNLPKVITPDDYGGRSYIIYDLFFKKILNLSLYVNKKEFYAPNLKSRDSSERDVRFPEPKVLFNKDKFLGASLSFHNHVTSLIRCSDKIFYYDNNAPINIKTQKRTIDFSEVINDDGIIEKHPEYLERFWNEGLNYLKHWGDYFRRYKGVAYDFGYIGSVRAKDFEFYDRVITFEKNDRFIYSKKIPVTRLDDSLTLKDIISCELLKTKGLILSTVKVSSKKIFIEECFEIVTNDLELYKNKYLFYKQKYLQLKKKINEK